METAQAALIKARPQRAKPQGEREDDEDDVQLQNDLRRVAERDKADKVCKLLESKTYLVDAMTTHVIPRAELESRAMKDDAYLEALPRWRFSRFYLRERIVVDLFPEEGRFKAADVEARRAWCHAEGLRYGALGPDMQTTDLVPQLEQGPEKKEKLDDDDEAAKAGAKKKAATKEKAAKAKPKAKGRGR